MMPLTLAGIGESLIIQRVGGNTDTRRFLENLGFLSGTKYDCLVFQQRKCDRSYPGITSCYQ